MKPSSFGLKGGKRVHKRSLSQDKHIRLEDFNSVTVPGLTNRPRALLISRKRGFLPLVNQALRVRRREIKVALNPSLLVTAD